MKKSKKFKRFYIEITNICNLNCSFCPPTARDRKFMLVDDFEIILNQIQELTDYLYFHVKGEPLLHPKIGEFLDISYQKGFKVNLTTNGHNIAKIKDIILNKPALRQISFSLQSIEETYDTKKIEKYMRDILEFIKTAVKETSIIIELRLWNLNIDSQAKSNNIINQYLLRMIEKELDLNFTLVEHISKIKGDKIKDKIYLSQSSVFEWPSINRETISTTGFCYGLRNQVAVLVDGTVIPCCLDSDGIINLGNIFKESINSILDSNRAKDIFKGFSNRKVVEPLCQRCGYRLRFDK